VNAGNQTLCLSLKTSRAVVETTPEFWKLRAFCERNKLDIVTIFSTQVAHPENQLRTRVFAAPFGYLEDPATGSGNAALGYHLHRCGHWDGRPIRIEQNADLVNPNIVHLGSMPDAAHGIRVTFGGSAKLRIEGRYWI
jgi:PhzF family phenazine biosynthesis protein